MATDGPDGGSTRLIPIAAPVFAGNEKAYVNDCLDSGWISSVGEYVGRFEQSFADYCGTRHAVACCNGTAALHLALRALGVSEGDEVIVPTLTFVASANAVLYCGARPVFVDSEPRTWNLDPAAIEAKLTPRTRGILVVHLYGNPVDMDAIRAIARRHDLFVLEDAAQAHGASYDGRRAGSLGDVATFSLYGNKIVTSGEGGIVLTDDGELVRKVELLRGQGMDPARRYWFPVVGFNYRMTNIAAAIALAQLERIDWHLERRREVTAWYREELADVPAADLQAVEPGSRSANWMFTVLLDEKLDATRDEVAARLCSDGIETRPVFYPVSDLPPYRDLSSDEFPVASRIARRGLSLPTWAGLTRDDVRTVCQAVRPYCRIGDAAE